MSIEFLSTPIEYLKGVGPKRADLLKKEIGVFCFEDLLYYFPFRYVDRSKFHSIASISSDQNFIQIKGKISEMHTVGTGRGKRLVAFLSDGTGRIELVWFQGIKWVVERIKAGTEYVVFGKPGSFKGKYSFIHPEIDPAWEPGQSVSATLQPFYNSSENSKAEHSTAGELPN